MCWKLDELIEWKENFRHLCKNYLEKYIFKKCYINFKAFFDIRVLKQIFQSRINVMPSRASLYFELVHLWYCLGHKWVNMGDYGRFQILLFNV